MGHMVAAAGHLRAVDGNRPWASGDHAAAFRGQLVERLAKLLRDLIACDDGYPCHHSPPSACRSLLFLAGLPPYDYLLKNLQRDRDIRSRSRRLSSRISALPRRAQDRTSSGSIMLTSI